MPNNNNKVEAPGPYCLGEKGWYEYAKNSQDLNLCRYYWPALKLDAKSLKAVIIAIHGHGAHTCIEYLKCQEIGKYHVYEGSWIEKLNQEGFSVCGFDLQSHGRSDGLNGYRCYFESFDDLVKDIHDFTRYVKETSSLEGFFGLPIFLLGTSLGGCIATNANYKEPDLYAGTILLAPMLCIDKVTNKGINPYLKPFGALASKLVPKLAVAETMKNTLYPKIQEEFDQDIMTYTGRARARVANEYLRITKLTCENMDDMSFPFITFHSKQDNYTDTEGSEKLHEKSKTKDKTIVLRDDMWHFLWKEPGHEEILEQIITWLNARTIKSTPL